MNATLILMKREYLALVLVLVGVIIFFWPFFQQFADDTSRMTGAIFAVGGVILWYLPLGDKGKKK